MSKIVYVVQSGAAEEDWIEAIFASEEDAVRKCHELAEQRSTIQRNLYKDNTYKNLPVVPLNVWRWPSFLRASLWEISERKKPNYLISLHVGRFVVSVRAWPLQ
jgi:hypothetical protein